MYVFRKCKGSTICRKIHFVIKSNLLQYIYIGSLHTVYHAPTLYTFDTIKTLLKFLVVVIHLLIAGGPVHGTVLYYYGACTLWIL